VSQLPLPARVLVSASIVAGAAILAYRLPSVSGWDRGDVLLYGVLVVAIVVAQQFPIALRHRTETENFSMVDAIWAAGLLLAPASVLTLAVATGVLVGQGLLRWSPHKIGFNAGQDLIGVSLALAVYGALSPGADEPLGWVAAALGMAVYFVVNAGTVALVIAWAERESFRGALLPGLRLSFVQWLGNVALGLLVGLVWLAEPAALPLLIVPLTMSYVAYYGWLKSIRERDLMREMVLTADSISQEGDLARRVAEAGDDDVGRLAATLNKMLDRLEAAFRLERRFISEASHELRTPITICRGHLEVLGKDPDPDELEESIALVVDELHRMGRIVDDLTTLARADTDRFLRPEPIALDHFLVEVAAKAVPLLDGRLRISPVPAGAVLDADPQRLTQALINLLQNAAVHCPNGSPVVLRVVEEAGSWRFEVEDQGGGIALDPPESAFQPFSRGKTYATGSGLGLPIVRRIAEAHGGSAGVANRPGEGATFWIRVPR
jgi:signal transduction histidine kinase